ncbi:kinesin light chain-like protein [Stylonychia lemnae]|uniref:Kinesin light chain-like protein n=1 Tax=Stylonychia lemnae TaxID=5949 RepID=A0A078A9T3_STYLE|nr:kinesin light chain-like protein [Stylonychia lemnae]|eukprot:CDW78939.1 kinesin light chain-like protein [Stylonychia lemnae]
MENFDYKKSKQRAKQLYKQGKYKEFLEFITNDTQKGAKSSDNLLLYGDTLILIARVQIEYGLFPDAEKMLAQLNQYLLSNQDTMNKQDKLGYFQLQFKFYHVQSKLFIRSNYLQKGFDFIKKSIAAIEKQQDKELEKIKYKYLCKLYEQLGHLYCEPYCFAEGEKELNKAEKIYLEHKDLFNKVSYRKFLIKKSSYMKKSGFFVEAMQILTDLEKELIEELKKPSLEHEEAKQLKKQLFKALRDQSRLHGLRRQDNYAKEIHARAEKLLKEEVYQGITNNIKIAKLQLIKSLWMAKFSFEQSNDELLEAFSLFIELSGSQTNYFGANCFFEIGSNYLRLNQAQTANGFVYKAYEIYKELFGERHPMMQKYYSYSSEVASSLDTVESKTELKSDEAVIMLSLQMVNLSEEVNNICEDGEPSIFVLDPLVSYISLLASNKDRLAEAEEKIAEAEHIFGIRGLAAGTQLLHSVRTVQSLILIKSEKLKDAMDLLEQSYESQVKVLKNNRAHPFLEHSISQLALLFRVNKKFNEAEEMYLNQIKIKELYYGSNSEQLIIPLRNLGQTYIYQENDEQAKEVLQRAVNIGREAIKRDSKLKTKIGDQVMEIYSLFYSIFEEKKQYDQVRFISTDLLDFTEEVFGEKSLQYSQAAFNRARVIMMEEGGDMNESKRYILKAVEIEEHLQENKTAKSVVLGRYLYCAGTIFSGLNDSKTAKTYFKRAYDIVKIIPGLEALTKELEQHIELCDEKNENSQEHNDGNSLGVSDVKQSRVEQKNKNQMTDLIIAGAAISVVIGTLTFAYLKFKGK